MEEAGVTINKKQTGRPSSRRNEENVAQLNVYVQDDPCLPTRKPSDAMAIPPTSLRRIMKLDLKLHPYKIQLVQELKENDLISRNTFVDTMFERFTNILFSDEAHFHLNRQVNKKNCSFWSEVNLQLKHQRPLHSPNISGAYIFEDPCGNSVTVNSAEYVIVLRDFFQTQL